MMLMICSHSEMFTIVNVPQGVHQYKFLVDGRWLCHPCEVCHVHFILGLFTYGSWKI